MDEGSRTIYDYFMKVLQQTYDLQLRGGQNIYNFIDKEIKEIFVKPRMTILISKQREFQFRLLHGAIYIVISIFIDFVSLVINYVRFCIQGN